LATIELNRNGAGVAGAKGAMSKSFKRAAGANAGRVFRRSNFKSRLTVGPRPDGVRSLFDCFEHARRADSLPK